MGQFVKVYRSRPKVNAGKSKVIVMNEEEGLECEVHIDGVHLEYISEFQYLGCILDEVGIDGAESSRKVAGAIRSLVNARDLQIECVRVLHEKMLIPVLTYGNEKIFWKERSRIWAMQMDNFPRGLLAIRRMDRVPNAQIRELCSDKRSR